MTDPTTHPTRIDPSGRPLPDSLRSIPTMFICPRCRLSIRGRLPALEPQRCPRCLVRKRLVVALEPVPFALDAVAPTSAVARPPTPRPV
jgi:hypothetical protein